MLKSFNLAGAVRISPLHCHAPSDVERFLSITEALTTL
jgi:selenocysteine lyase/cysteine desulfurase